MRYNSMEKITIERNTLRRLLEFYDKQLYIKFEHTLLTEASVHLMNQHLRSVQETMKLHEPRNTYWNIEVKLVIDQNHRSFYVDVVNVDDLDIT
jgi:hypothetical protein